MPLKCKCKELKCEKEVEYEDETTSTLHWLSIPVVRGKPKELAAQTIYLTCPDDHTHKYILKSGTLS